MRKLSPAKKKNLPEIELLIAPEIDFRPALLVSCELERHLAENHREKHKPQKFYNAVVYPPLSTEDASTAVCEFMAGEQHDGNSTFQVSATYVVGFFHERAPSLQTKRKLLEYLVLNSAWPRFVDLFASLVSQSGADLPQLFLSLPEVVWETRTQKRQARKAKKSNKR